MKKKAKQQIVSPKQPFFERNYVQYLVLFALILVQYAQTSSFDYALDDTIVITKNSKVQKGWKGIPELFENRNTGKTEDRTGYRPVSLISFATDVQLFGLNPKPSHVINLLLYALACVLLLKFLKDLFPEKQWLAFLITVLYTVHPLHTEVVANIKSRDEILAMIFGLLFLHAHIKYFKTDKLKYVLVAPLLFILAALSKESALTFVGLGVAISLFSSEYSWKNRLISAGSSVSAVAVIGAIRLLIYSEEFYDDRSEELRKMGVYNIDGFVGNPMVDIDSPMLILANGMNIFLQSVQMFFIPHPLVHDYSFNHFPIIIAFLGSPRVWLGLISFLATAGVALYGFRKKNLITIGAAWFFITISIYLSIVAPATDIFAERFLFFPSIGLTMVVAGLLEKIPGFDRKKLTITTFVLAVPMLVLSTLRVPAWESSKTLLEHDIDKLEYCVRANYNYALLRHQAYDKYPRKRKAGDEEIILKHYNRALSQTDRMDNLFLALGNAYMRFGMREKGRDTFKAYMRAHPNLAKPYTQVGNYYATSSMFDSAIYYFEKSVEVGSINSENYLNLGLAYYNANEFDKAIAVLQKGEPYAKTNQSYYRKFSGVCIKAKEYDLAEEVVLKGLFFFPNDEMLLGYKQQFDARRAAKQLGN